MAGGAWYTRCVPFELTADNQRLIDWTRVVAERTLRPLAEKGEPGRVNRPLIKALSESAFLLRRLFPQRVGGSVEGAPSAMELCLLREVLAQECIEAETALAMQGLGGYPILWSERPEMAERWLPRIARGQAVAAFALSEPEHGSDAASIELRAERDGDDWRLTGVKTWISNAPEADVYTVFARTTPGAGGRGITAFAVPGGSKGLTGDPLNLLSQHPIGRLEFDGVPVKDEQMVGELDGGFRIALRTLDFFRPSVGAYAVGMAQAALDAAIRHAGGRHAFGRAIRDFQAVSHSLAEMATRTEAARLLVYAAASAVDRGGRTTKASSMAKLYATETAQWVVDRAIQIHGAAALEETHLLARLYRDVRAPRIYEGTTEIQREVIARELYR